MALTPDEYLKPTPTIDSQNRSIKEKARALTRGQAKITDKAQRLFYFVRDEIKYSGSSPRYLLEHFRASHTLKEGEGYCVQKAILLAALARASGLPARLGYTDQAIHFPFGKLAGIMGTNVLVYNGYSELYIEGKWLKTSPSLDLGTCLEQGIIPVEFDGTREAMLHPRGLNGELQFEYILDHGHYPDFPFDEIRSAMEQSYGPGLAQRIKRSPHYDEIMARIAKTYGPEVVRRIIEES